MSRYPGNDYSRGGRSPPRWNQDRRQSHNEPPRRNLRDAPPLGRGGFRDSRDFSPRDVRDDPIRPRRNSRDDGSSGSGYFDSPAGRGGFGRGRGRGDYEYHGNRGRPRFPDDERDYRPGPPRDRTPPRYFRDASRGERSPDRREERPFQRRDEPRWSDRNDRERDFDRRRPEPLPRLDARAGNDNPSSSGPPPATHVNPERLALIEDAGLEPARRASIKPDAYSYISGRAENTSNRYSRGASPPTQPPPVPAFTLSFAPPAPAQPPSKPHTEIKQSQDSRPVSSEGAPSALPRQEASKPTDSTSEAISAAPPPSAPKAPRAETEASRLQHVRSSDALSNSSGAQSRQQPMSPVIQTRPGVVVPTGPKAGRTSSQSSVSPRMPFTTLNRDGSAPLALQRSRSPPIAPTGPRSHGSSVSPEMKFAAAPSAPRAERIPPVAPRALDRSPVVGRTFDRSAPMARTSAGGSRPQAWNTWRRQDHVEDVTPSNPSTQEPRLESLDKRPEERILSNISAEPVTSKPDRTEMITPTARASAASGPSAHQSFIGQPALEDEDEADSDTANDALLGSLSTTEDEDDMGVGDLALFEAKHERQRRDLESKLVDLSERRYRATTPLEQIARLSRITMSDVERFKNRENDMDIDDPQTLNEQSVPPATHSSESDEIADLPTPADAEDASVLIHDVDEDGEEEVRRIRRPTPELVNLPYMTKSPQTAYHETEEYIHRVAAYESLQSDFRAEMQIVIDSTEQLNSELEELFFDNYRKWRQECVLLDREREEAERLERQASFEPGPEPEPQLTAALNPIVEGRKLHKFSSEYELNLILEQSRETARIEQEKAEQEARKNQADMEKEAIVPDQMTAEELHRSVFVDNNRLREPETLTVVFTYEPYPDDFTEKEQEVFTAAFKETPKKWSEIASLLPGREPKDCIRHYYANKWDGRFRDTRRKFKSRKRGGAKAIRGKGSAAMADLSRVEDLSGPVATSDSGRPKRAAAPTTFGERETEAKALLAGQSPIKRAGPSMGKDGQSDDKPVKRRRAATDKPGRKAKGSQPLASLAAAPILSPDGRAAQLPSKESIERSRLEEASLLTGFHAGRPAAHTEAQPIFANQDNYMAHRALEDPGRMRTSMQASAAKQSPSSYWSVPEQNDFVNYINFFGTDFGAIASHMGTKTQTMIKNHYQRQVDGGKGPDLVAAAENANARRLRGEDMGAPPVPTPITKRKYDQPSAPPQRSLLSHSDQMDIDDGIGSRSALKQHGSPPQYQMQPRYSGSAPGPPSRVPSDSSSTPILGTSVPTRTFQAQPRMSMFGGHRAESRPSLSAGTSYTAPLGTPTGQSAQASRTMQDAQDPQYIQSLLDEQRKAMRVQGHYPAPERVDFHPRPTQVSPSAQPALLHGDRKPLVTELRTSSPPASFNARGPPPSRPFEGRFVQHVNPPLPKREDSRNSIGSSTHPAPAAEAPKRSNVMSLLNDTEEPKSTKRNSTEHVPAAAIPRHGSPAQHGTIPPPFNQMPSSRVEGYAQGPNQPYRSSLQGPAVSSALKQEPLSAASSIQSAIPPKSEWPARSTHGASTPPSGAPSYDRSGRPYYHHPSTMLGHMSTPNRANPSPPPHTSLQHSHTPSMTTVEPHRAYIPGAPPGSAPSRQSSLYGQQSHPPSYSQAPLPVSSQAPSHAHHPSTLTSGYQAHQRGPSRDDGPPPPPMFRERERELDREREDREWRFRAGENERRRADQIAQRQYEQERQYSRAAPVPAQSMHPQFSAYEQNQSRHDGNVNMREQSRREVEMALQYEERSRNTYNGDRETDGARRRHDDAYLPGARRTPIGGGYGAPGSNMPPARR